jgi:hypothetical protein
MIHRALFIVEDGEYNRVKYLLRGKLGREATPQQILKEA